eukprot:CAMPEP_0180803474 /NCGR_PEP_ID=MMETSP1038_2-20121128/60916_1 /TAXON_ID=632150 /ORGANISM="Azadinium spinosum, Strain 3D9" /LENGTH=43 /DNA_ID= /DNA_START= /DNA_END= /DNA_ORIENTATION=
MAHGAECGECRRVWRMAPIGGDGVGNSGEASAHRSEEQPIRSD